MIVEGSGTAAVDPPIPPPFDPTPSAMLPTDAKSLDEIEEIIEPAITGGSGPLTVALLLAANRASETDASASGLPFSSEAAMVTKLGLAAVPPITRAD